MAIVCYAVSEFLGLWKFLCAENSVLWQYLPYSFDIGIFVLVSLCWQAFHWALFFPFLLSVIHSVREGTGFLLYWYKPFISLQKVAIVYNRISFADFMRLLILLLSTWVCINVFIFCICWLIVHGRLIDALLEQVMLKVHKLRPSDKVEFIG